MKTTKAQRDKWRALKGTPSLQWHEALLDDADRAEQLETALDSMRCNFEALKAEGERKHDIKAPNMVRFADKALAEIRAALAKPGEPK